MTHHPTHFPLDQGDFDLSNIFIGRKQQIDLFEAYFHRWKSSLTQAASDNDVPMQAAPSPHNKIQALIILLYGPPGFGKSTLLRHYRNRVLLEENEHPQAGKVLASEIVDWKTLPDGQRRLFTLSLGEEIDASSYFSKLCTQLARAIGKKVHDFKQYQRAAQGVKDGQQQAHSVLDSLALRELAGRAGMTLLRWLAPRVTQALDTMKVTEKIEEVLGKGAEISAELLMHAYWKLHDKLGRKLDDYLEPELRLGFSLGRDLYHFARNFPLLVFFDTYEVIDEGDNLLRIVMGAAGQRVGWVIAGRDNLWAGLDQRLRNRGIETGYKEIVQTGKEIDFNVGSIGAFTPSDIAAYFVEIRQRVQASALLPPLTQDELASIWDVTKGIPLAISIAADLYLKTRNVAAITKSVQGKRGIIDQMVRRYLLHVRDTEQDRAKLYALALLRRPDPLAVSAALGLTLEQAKPDFAFTNELTTLHRRYSFVFPGKEEPALHQEVRHFLRLWLLEHRSQPDIMTINEQLKVAHKKRLDQLEKRGLYSNLKERLQDDTWVSTYLDLVEQQFWIDPVEGVRTILPFMLAAVIYRHEASKEANDIGTFFAETIGLPYRNWWTWASQGLVRATNRGFLPEEPHGLEDLEELLRQQRSIFPPPLSTFRNELEAALWWRLGATTWRDSRKALEWYEKALSRLNHESELRKDAADTCWYISNRLLQEKKHAECLLLLARAIELKPDHVLAYSRRGDVYRHLKQYEYAITDYTTAISFSPNYADNYSRRGTVSTYLEQYEHAIADYTTVISLDPDDAPAYYDRGHVYRYLEQYEHAIADYTTVISLDLSPHAAAAYTSRGNVYYDLKQYEDAIADYTAAIFLDPDDAPAYYDRGSAYLWLKDTRAAVDDYCRYCELDQTAIIASWMAEWADMNKERIDSELITSLEQIAKRDPKDYVAYICRGVAMGLRGKLKQGLAEIEQAISLRPEDYDAYFWKGTLRASYYHGPSHDKETIKAIEKALEGGLPPVLLTPLYWLERDNPAFFARYAQELLEKYEV